MAPSKKQSPAPNAGLGGSASNSAGDALGPEDEGALRIGATDRGMVRLILTTRAGVVELDYPPEDAREIAEEMRAAAAQCDGAPPVKGGERKG